MRRGVFSGVFGCCFGVLGILTSGLIFVPLAAICSFFGLLSAVTKPNVAGIGASLMGCVLTFIGFLVSPSLWVLWVVTSP